MMKYVVLFLYLITVSCNFNHKQEVKSFSLEAKDTLIVYDIEGVSTEGAEAKVNYVNGKISNSITSIYGETGQATIMYEFETDRIKVVETKYFYKSEIKDLKSDEDMALDYKISYFIDFKGDIIGEENLKRINIFKEFQAVVPFEL